LSSSPWRVSRGGIGHTADASVSIGQAVRSRERQVHRYADTLASPIGSNMQMTAIGQTWVVYSVPSSDPAAAPRAVCTDAEWAALERGRPGVYSLVQAGILTEPEAERLARGSAGADAPRLVKFSPFARRRDDADELVSSPTVVAS
jgi:hypothetical protein